MVPGRCRVTTWGSRTHERRSSLLQSSRRHGGTALARPSSCPRHRCWLSLVLIIIPYILSLPIYLPIFLSTYLPIYLPTYLSIYPSIYPYLYLSICTSICKYIYVYIYICKYIYIYWYWYLYIYLSNKYTIPSTALRANAFLTINATIMATPMENINLMVGLWTLHHTWRILAPCNPDSRLTLQK